MDLFLIEAILQKKIVFLVFTVLKINSNKKYIVKYLRI